MSTPTAKPRRLPESVWRELRTAHASGIGLRELARNAGIPAGTMLARAKREGWTRQLRQARAIVPAAQQPPAVTVVDAVALTMAERGQRHLERMAGVVEKTLPAVEGMEPEGILDRIEDIDRLDKIGRRTYGLDDRGAGEVRINVFSDASRIIDIDAMPTLNAQASE